jgi:hypothetical protein
MSQDAPGPFYDPPYDSPIEDVFAVTAYKYLHEGCELQKQVEVPTICGTYRLDFRIVRGGYRREYHDSHRDEWRDALIFGANGTDIIYRLRGCDLTYHTEDLLYLMSRADPYFFSDRGRSNLSRLASEEARASDGDLSPRELVTYRYDPEQPNQGMRYIWLQRWTRYVPPNRRALWWDWWRHAPRYAGHCKDIETMMAMHDQWLDDLNAGKVSAAITCAECRQSVRREDSKGVWDSRTVCRPCYAALYTRNDIAQSPIGK